MAWQLTDLDALGISPGAAATQVQYVDARGHVSAGAEGIAQMLIRRGGIAGAFGHTMRLAGVRNLAALVYRIVSENRHRLPGGTPACRLAASDSGSDSRS